MLLHAYAHRMARLLRCAALTTILPSVQKGRGNPSPNVYLLSRTATLELFITDAPNAIPISKMTCLYCLYRATS